MGKVGISPALPLTYTKADGPYGLNKNIRDAIQQNFKNLLLTTKGERVMIPNLPFIEIVELDFLTSNEQPDEISLNQINLRIRYEILPINEADTLTIFESVN